MEVVKWVFVGILVVGTLYACYVVNKNAPKQDVPLEVFSPSDPSSDSLPWVQKREDEASPDGCAQPTEPADPAIGWIVVISVLLCFALTPVLSPGVFLFVPVIVFIWKALKRTAKVGGEIIEKGKEAAALSGVGASKLVKTFAMLMETKYAGIIDKEALTDCAKMAYRDGQSVEHLVSSHKSLEQVANFAVRQVLFVYLASGDFHMYRGCLGLRGSALLEQYQYLLSEAGANGWASDEEIAADRELLESAIKQVG